MCVWNVRKSLLPPYFSPIKHACMCLQESAADVSLSFPPVPYAHVCLVHHSSALQSYAFDHPESLS